MLIDSTHFAAELCVIAQAREAMKKNLLILEAALSDLVCGREALLAPPVLSAPVVPAPRPTRVQRHGREAFARFLGTHLAAGLEQPVQEIFVAWRQHAPAAKITSVRTWLSDMVAQGEVIRRPLGKHAGVYSVPPMLRVVAEGE
jgi:hypothetical protein